MKSDLDQGVDATYSPLQCDLMLELQTILFCWESYLSQLFPHQGLAFFQPEVYMGPAQLRDKQNICFLWSGSGTKFKAIAKAIKLPADAHTLVLQQPFQENSLLTSRLLWILMGNSRHSYTLTW